jgi:DNA polymerase elongation subunit (family B)
MKENIYILDIETTPDKKLIEVYKQNVKYTGQAKDPKKIEAALEEKREAWHKNMCVDLGGRRIIKKGIKKMDETIRGQTKDIFQVNVPVILKLEEMEAWFANTIYDAIVTFNGKAFDIPVIIKSGIKKGCRFPYSELYQMTERYKQSRHIDLIQLLSFGNPQNTKSLNKYLQIYLGTKKDTLGDDFFRTATKEEIVKHCVEDLYFTEDLFKMFRFVK